MSNRRPLDWKKINGWRPATALAIATWFGSGLLPKAPGTWGALAATPVAYFTADWTWFARVTLWVGLTFAGTWASKVFDETMGSADNQNIVIDEVIGIGITAWTAGHDLKTLAVAFVLFRLFDISKLPPVRQLDHLSKKASGWIRGFGVLADDIVAGFQGLAVILILQRLGFLP